MVLFANHGIFAEGTTKPIWISLVSLNESDTDEISLNYSCNTLKYLFLVYIYPVIPIVRLFIWR